MDREKEDTTPQITQFRKKKKMAVLEPLLLCRRGLDSSHFGNIELLRTATFIRDIRLVRISRLWDILCKRGEF